VEDTEQLHQSYHQTSIMMHHYDSSTLDKLKETPNYLLDCTAKDFDYNPDGT
jgi:hypothetical protein